MSSFRCKNEKCKIYNERFEEVVIVNGEKRCPICKRNQINLIRPIKTDNADKEIEIPLNKN